MYLDRVILHKFFSWSSYLVGTEEGQIHRCSCSYNEQYLDSYHGHTGPINRITWSPFSPEVFLSCSGDWTLRLWHQDKTSPVLNFYSSQVTFGKTGSSLV